MTLHWLISMLLILQEYDFEEYAETPEGLGAVFAAISGGVLLVILIIAVIQIASLWKLFTMAGKPGWAVLIPIYNIIVLLEIVGRPLWWIILMLIPCVNIVVTFIVYIDFAKSYGKDTVWGILLVLFGVIFLPILAFSSSTQYVGPAAAPSTPQY